MTLRDSREWTTVVSSKTCDGSAKSMWTRCPRQAWPRSSLIIKHYRVLEGNHHQWYRSLHAWRSKDFTLEQTPLSWTSQSVAWCARDTYRMEVAILSNHSILRTCMTDLGWYQRKQKQSFSNSRRQLAPNVRESKKVTSFIQHLLHERDMKIMPFRSFQH